MSCLTTLSAIGFLVVGMRRFLNQFQELSVCCVVVPPSAQSGWGVVVVSVLSHAKGLSALVLKGLTLTHMRVWFLLDSEDASVGPFFLGT